MMRKFKQQKKETSGKRRTKAHPGREPGEPRQESRGAEGRAWRPR